MSEKMVSALYLHALTPVHAGTGQVSASVVDLPIAREKATHWPVLPATSLKGVLKASADELGIGKEEILRLFGGESEKDGKKVLTPGKLQFGDGRILSFPVRSWQGVFAYVTCPLALIRLQRDFSALGIPVPFTGDVPTPPSDEVAHVAAGTVLMEQEEFWLDDLKLTGQADEATTAIAKSLAATIFPEKSAQDGFVSRFALLSDNLFDFLTETATEITARVALKEDTKTVRDGGLWYEEAVPAEAIFVAPILGDTLPVKQGTVIQVGGNETVGRGLCRVKVATK
jgi:CRISPR-associated protein Cmr4